LPYDSFWEEASYIIDEARKRVSELRRIVRHIMELSSKDR